MEAKRKLIREAKRFQGVWCRACRHKCMDQQATHCPTCGVRFTSKGVIAVGDIGSENFQEQTRESRASLADRLAERASLESRPGTAGLIEAPAEEAQPQPWSRSRWRRTVVDEPAAAGVHRVVSRAGECERDQGPRVCV